MKKLLTKAWKDYNALDWCAISGLAMLVLAAPVGVIIVVKKLKEKFKLKK